MNKLETLACKDEPGNNISKTQLIRQISQVAWQKLSFVTFRQKRVTWPRGLKTGEIDTQAEEKENALSIFLDQLDNCLKPMSACEWDQRRRLKKKDKLSTRQFALPPTQSVTGAAQEDHTTGRKAKLMIMSPSGRTT